MYGYIIPDKPNMLIKDFTFFRAFYCGFCKSIGKKCGQVARLGTNYDMTFFNIFLHNVMNKEIEICQEACILNPVRKKPVVKNDDLTELVVDVNTLMFYYKVEDDYFDGKKFEASMLAPIIKPKAKKARERMPEIDALMKEQFVLLREMERAEETSIDKVSEPFSIIISETARIILGEKFNDDCYNLCYNLGKWVYLMDALDDISEDYEEKRYNPFLAKFQNYESREQFLETNKENLEFIMISVYNGIVNSYNRLDVKISEGILSNVFYLGLKKQTDDMIKGETKCKTIRL